MGIIVPSAPQWAMEAGYASVDTIQVTPDENAFWREGDILTTGTTGTIASPNPNGALSALPGPAVGTSLVTLGITPSANKPAQDYYGILTFIGAANIESQASAPFIISCPFGYLPTISVSATGAPAAATDFGVYLGTIPGQYFRQSIATALGGTYTGTNPLTNHTGVVRAGAGISAGIIGMADCNSDRFYAGYPGGSQQTSARSLFGASQAMSPGWDNNAFQLPVTKLAIGYVVMNLLQPWYDSLQNSAAGLNIDTGNTFVAGGTNFFIVDNTQTACLTIVKRMYQNGYGNIGDIGARVLCKFYPAALA